MISNLKKFPVLVASALLVVVFFILVPPIAQDLSYHAYADGREYLGLTNFFNIISNSPFLIIGVLGLWLHRQGKLQVISELNVVYKAFFLGLIFTSFSSSYYHLDPTNVTLTGDRLGLAILFASFFSIVVGELISASISKKIFWGLMILSMGSVLYWHVSELLGTGDLRPYAVVQFLPIFLFPIILMKYKSIYSHQYIYWIFISIYLLAKVFEIFDPQIAATLGGFGGHAIKHLLSAASCALLLYTFYIRKPVGAISY
jgi:hypothetical protein